MTEDSDFIFFEVEQFLRNFIVDKRLKVVPNRLLVVPDELIAFEIFTFLPIEDILGNIVLCCKRFHFLVKNNDSLWKILFKREFPYGCPLILEKKKLWAEKFVGFKTILKGRILDGKPLDINTKKLLLEDKVFVMTALKNHSIFFFPKKFKNDKEVTLNFIKGSDKYFVITDISVKFLYDKDVLFEILKKDVMYIKQLPKNIIRNFKFIQPILQKIIDCNNKHT